MGLGVWGCMGLTDERVFLLVTAEEIASREEEVRVRTSTPDQGAQVGTQANLTEEHSD